MVAHHLSQSFVPPCRQGPPTIVGVMVAGERAPARGWGWHNDMEGGVALQTGMLTYLSRMGLLGACVDDPRQ